MNSKVYIVPGRHGVSKKSLHSIHMYIIVDKHYCFISLCNNTLLKALLVSDYCEKENKLGYNNQMNKRCCFGSLHQVVGNKRLTIRLKDEYSLKFLLQVVN